MVVGYETPIEKLGLSTRTYNALRRNGYKTAGEIKDAGYLKITKARNVGEMTIEEIESAIGVLDGHEGWLMRRCPRNQRTLKIGNCPECGKEVYSDADVSFCCGCGLKLNWEAKDG